MLPRRIIHRSLPYNYNALIYHHAQYSFFTNSDPSNKVWTDPMSAIIASELKSGDTLLSGGFGICGIPSGCIQAIHDLGNDKINNLTVVSNNCGIDDWGNGILLGTHCISSTIKLYAI